MSFTLFPSTRLALALESLAGLSVGDALGAQDFVSRVDLADPPPAPWPWTDDTEEACCLVAVLAEGDFDRDAFADLLGRHHDPYRGYGPGAVVMLREIREGLPWPIAAAAAFDGEGSAGNGAAMRAAPLGAWHADSLAHAAAQGARAAEVTHAHAEGIAGGVAVTVAAAVAAAGRLDGQRPALLGAVAAHTPDGHVRDGLVAAARFSEPGEASYELGNGTRAMARDTVPFAVWVADRFLDDYPGAIAACVRAGGDVDTTCAIAGGIVAAYTGLGGIPPAWLAAREPLPGWLSVVE
ncbi:ADP-ribosylglycohydrolase family protein [Actinoplanes sp. LDG1-06]|uniref:ADP-ribosylglycohydrolase family protein n=1 Tax=Paractinoplanes ovalisporus TaxID=2810368 RepID=A0ABS2ARG9_9ACTN|nr:ADP-ribosylglycohydrolase family protein [Actinoplanes ovalisporus]MBM2622338.1 ADP-ribosylglycohydrolase family protein [Actinoplanes ovalisporus]